MQRTILTASLVSVLLSLLISFAPSAASGGDQDPAQEKVLAADATGAQIYEEKCATCHDKPTARIPPRAQVAKLATEDVIRTMTTGTMKQWAEGLSPAQITTLATFVTGKPLGSIGPTPLSPNICQTPKTPINLNGPQWNGWGRDLQNSRFQPKPGLAATDVPKLKVK